MKPIRESAQSADEGSQSFMERLPSTVKSPSQREPTHPLQEKAAEAVLTSAGYPKPDDLQRWFGWSTVALERLPLPYPLTVTLVGLMAVAEQVLERSIHDPTLSGLASITTAKGLVFPILLVYILIFLRMLKRNAVKALVKLRPTVQISDEEYDAYVHRMVHTDKRVGAILLVASVAIMLILFVVLQAELLSSASGLPRSLPVAAFILGNYVLFGWLLLLLFCASIQQAFVLSALARRPLAVNVFDLTNLLPFGRLALLHSLPNVGVVLIPLILLGPPTQAGYLVIFLSLASLLVLFLPIWGVHQQIDEAKERVLVSIHEQLGEIQEVLLRRTELNVEDLAGLADHTTVLVHLRRLIEESPNWPFKDTAAVARSIVAVSSPLVYFVLNEIIRTYLFPT